MNDIDRALDACEGEIRAAIQLLGLAGDQIRIAAAGLPERPLTAEQNMRRVVLLAALAVAQRTLKDALDGRAELSAVEREAQRLAAQS